MLSADDVESLNQEGRGKFLLPTDRVVALEINGDARVYPLRFMRWHEVVNDTVGDHPILVSYNPLCDSSVVASRVVGIETLQFGTSGLVVNSNPLLFDRRVTTTESSLWSQLDGTAVAGPATIQGRQLALLPSSLTTWGEWLERHPSTQVLAPLERLKRIYKRDPYHSYFGSDVLRFPVDPLPTNDDLRLKDRVLILTVDDHDTVFSLSRLAELVSSSAGSWSTVVDGLEIVIHFDAIRGAALVEWADIGDRRVASRQAFWFAWYAAHPDTRPPLP
jgi:hypothetical protein